MVISQQLLMNSVLIKNLVTSSWERANITLINTTQQVWKRNGSSKERTSINAIGILRRSLN